MSAPATVNNRTDGRITIELDAHQARVLARLLLHYSVLSSASAQHLLRRWIFEDPTAPDAPALPAVQGYDPETWQHTAVSLSRAVVLASAPTPRLVAVPRRTGSER